MFERINEAAARMERQQDITRAMELARHLPEATPVRERIALARRIRRTQRMLRGEPVEPGPTPTHSAPASVVSGAPAMGTAPPMPNIPAP